MVKYMLCKHAVIGSNPIGSMMFRKIFLNQQKRQSFFNFEKEQLINKILSKQIFIINNESKELKDIYHRGVKRTQIKNICYLSGRTRGVLRSFRLSRITFRTLASKGLLTFVKKISK